MILDSLLTGVMLFSSFAMRTPNVQPNPDDYEVSIGITQKFFHVNRQWEQELGKSYIDDLLWLKIDAAGVYFKPEYMNKESHEVRYFKVDWRKSWKDLTYGMTSRNDEKNVFSKNFETFVSVGFNKKKKYKDDKVEVEVSFDGYLPPDESGENSIFEYEDKFKVTWMITEKVKIYNMGEISKIQGTDYYKTKIGIEVSL